MSDSEEFGGLGPTTPYAPKVKAASMKPNSNRAAEAGPSKSTAAGPAPKAGNKKRPAPSVVDGESDGDDVREVPPPRKSARSTAASRKPRSRPISKREVEEVEEDAEEEEEERRVFSVEDEEDNVVEVIETTKPAGRLGPKNVAGTSGGVNGHAKGGAAVAKGKGKAKAKSNAAPASSKYRIGRQEQPEVMDVDSIYGPMEVQEQEVEVEEIEEQHTNFAPTIGKSGANGGRTAQASKHAKNLEETRLRERLRQSERHIENLTRQLEELCQVRQTEPEQLLERMEQQHQNEIQGRDALIKDLTTQLARKDPLFRSGKTAGFEIITRDEAKKEMQELQSNLKQFKEVIKERDRQLKEQGEQAEDLRQEVNSLRIELKAEIERGNSLAANSQRQPSSASRNRPAGLLSSNADPKQTVIIKFYEDLTNLLVPNMKVQNGKYMNGDDWVLSCVFTHRDVTDQNSIPKSLQFNLRLCRDLKSGETEPVVSKNQLVDSVHYTPLNLEHESDEFTDSLEFLSKPFTFERDQLSLFARTLHDFMGEKGGGDNTQTEDSGSDGSSVQLLE